MSDDLGELATWVEWHALPTLPCPACKIGQLRAEDYKTVEAESSVRLKGHEDWAPDWITGHFTGTLRCSRVACREPVVVAGDYSVDWTWYEDDGEAYNGPGDYLKIRFAQPPIPIMVCPPTTPEDVQQRIAQ